MQRGFSSTYLIIGVLVIVLVGYLYKNNSSPLQNTSTIQPPSSLVTTISTPIPSPSLDYRVSYTSVDGEIYLKYNGKVYGKDDLNKSNRRYDEPVVSGLSSRNDLDWKILLNPTNIEIDGYNELFSFKVFPDNKRFLFVMRWSRPPTGYGKTFQVFYFDGNSVSDPISLQDSNYPSIPKIDQISLDGEYVSFDMYSCWNCGGHYPYELLLKIGDMSVKRIGSVSYFQWGSNGAYEYKDYIEEPCSYPGPGVCFKKPETLPLKTGQF